MAGTIANRWNTTMLAFTQPLTVSPVVTDPAVTRYTPNGIEWAAALGIVAGLTLLFSLGMRYLPAFKGHAPKVVEEDIPIPTPEITGTAAAEGD